MGDGSSKAGKAGTAGKAHELIDANEPAKKRGSRTSDAPSGIKPVLTPPAGFDYDASIRDRMPTITDEDALENARLQSLPSNLPPPRRPLSTVPGPLAEANRNARDSSAEIDTGEADLEALDDAEQIAVLLARLAPLNRVPSLAKQLAELGPLLEDPKTAFVLGFVDGLLPLETIIDVTGLPELETLRVLDRMVGQSIVVFRGR